MTLAVSLTTIDVAYLAAGVLLIVGIKRLSSPATARSGNVVAAAGMGIALLFTLLHPDMDSYWLIAIGVAVLAFGRLLRGLQARRAAVLSAVSFASVLALYVVFAFVSFGIARWLRAWIEKLKFVELDRHLGAGEP